MKKVVSIALVIAMVLAFMPIGVLADEDAEYLTAIGDSITTGHGLDGYAENGESDDSFVSLLAKSLGCDFDNLAVDGITSQELAESLQAIAQDKESEEYKALTNATIITISIGGNDLLKSLYQIIAKVFKIDLASPNFQEEFNKAREDLFKPANVKQLGALMTELKTFVENMNPIVDAYAENLVSIIGSLYEINPYASVVMLTIHNPYAGITGFEALTAQAAEAMNAVIIEGGDLGYYNVADVYTAFSLVDEVLTNATNTETYLDPHPNKAGHALIAELVYNELFPAYNSYADVTESDWYYDVVSFLVMVDILKPQENENFNGDKTVTKGEALTFITNTLGGQSTPEQLVELGILKEGYNPDDTLTRGELFARIFKFLEVNELMVKIADVPLANFSDYDKIPEEARAPIQTLCDMGIVAGNENAALRLTANVTKGELTQVIFNAMYYLSVLMSDM